MSGHLSAADPASIISPPRVHMVRGFHYFYAETPDLTVAQVGPALGGLFARLFAGYEKLFGQAEKPPVMAMHIDRPGDRLDVRMGMCLQSAALAPSGLQLRYEPPAAVASLVVQGDLQAMISSYPVLMKYVREQSLIPVVGWREYYLYWEEDGSPNNIVWVQHLVEQAASR